VEGLVDIALLFGPAAVDFVLRAPAAAAAAAVVALGRLFPPVSDHGHHDDHIETVNPQQPGVMASAEHGRPDSTANSCDVGGKGLLGLLLSQAEQLLSELQAPSAGPKAARRGEWQVW
jgi:hypothetical protein